jgi:hypothetical protein
MKKIVFILATLILSNCANNGWPHYNAAMKCHFEDKGQECDGLYETAIDKNDKLPGVYSSYGAHLLKQGKNAEANEQFVKETAAHPLAKKPVARLLNKGSSEKAATIVPASASIEYLAPINSVESIESIEKNGE